MKLRPHGKTEEKKAELIRQRLKKLEQETPGDSQRVVETAGAEEAEEAAESKDIKKNKSAKRFGKKPFGRKKYAGLIEMAEAETESEGAAKPTTPEEQDELEEQRKRATALIIRRRALVKAVKRISRTKKITLLLIVIALILMMTFCGAVVQERMGNFTININRMEVYRQGIMLADNKDFIDPKSRLKAEAVQNATNISIEDLPENLDAVDGQHNGEDYMAYTFYIRNGGREIVDYYTNIAIEMEVKGVSEAVRIAVYDDDGKRTVYAKAAKNGKPEPGTVAFVSDDLVMESYVKNFEVNDVDKYTVVIWLEGDDPECVDAIIGGMIRMTMNVDIADPISDDDDKLHRD